MKRVSGRTYHEGNAVIVGFGIGLFICVVCGSLAIGLGLGVGLGAVIDGWLRVQLAQRTRKWA